jgi:hypothetical protein
MNTTIEAPRPEPLPFCWPSQDLKNLVQLAPLSPYTRALLRIKFNRPVPDGCTTFEQIEAWLATLPPPVPPPPTPRNAPTYTAPRSTRRDEISRGEYVTITGRIEGWSLMREYWTQEEDVQVPLSIWEDGENAVRDYVYREVCDSDRSYGETEGTGDRDDDGLEILDDLEDLLEQAEEMIARRDGEEDEDEDDDE